MTAPDLVEFLRARLDEDEAAARADDERRFWPDPKAQDTQNGRHIARWSPTRVLAEVAAKRAILDLHQFRHDDSLTDGYSTWDAVDFCATCVEYDSWEHPSPCWPCPTLLALAQPYAEHVDFDPAWKVDAS